MNKSVLLPRRTLLQGATLASAYFIGGVALPEAASAVSPKLSSQNPVFNPGGMVCATTRFYDAKWHRELTASFPMRIKLLHRGENRRFAASWDARLFAVQGDAYSVSKATTSEVKASKRGESLLEFSMPTDTDEVVLQATPLNIYPNDSLADFANTIIEIREQDGSVADRIELKPVGVECSPWGIEASVTWISVDSAIVPGRITLLSTGPDDAPKDLEMEMVCGTDVRNPAATLAGEPAPIAYRRRVKDGVATIAMRTTEALAASSSVEIIFDETTSDSEPDKFGRVVPYFRVVTPVHRVGMRASSQDSYYPVTNSGSQLSTYVSVPTAGE